MALVAPNTADLLILKWILNYVAQDGTTAPSGGDRVLKIFTNNITPAKSTLISDVQISTETGFSPITLTGTNWIFATNSGINSATYPIQTFNYTEAVSAYGYYITTQDNQLIFIEKFIDGPYILPSFGGQITVTPKVVAN